MIFYQTEQAQKTNQLPTALDVQQVMLDRGLLHSYDDKRQIHRLEAGEMGEQEVQKLFEKHGLEHWVGLKNLRLDYYGSSECDFVLLVKNCMYTFEIKNYSGSFTYKDGICSLNGHTISSNCVDQARNAASKLRNIFKANSRKISVKSVVLFTGENSQINIESEVNDVEMVHLTDLYQYIQKIICEEKDSRQSTVHLNQTIQILENYETSSPYGIKPLSKEHLKNARCGIHCAHCKNYNVQIEKSYIKCPCGLHEPRDEAVIRSICDYGVLNFENHLTFGELYNFLGGKVSHGYLKKILATHFEMVKNGRYSYYINLKLPYKKIYSLFEIDLPLYFHSTRGRPMIHIYD